MLFYNIKLHCYVVVEVKVTEFDSRDMGQLGTYMVAVNYQLKGETDAPTLGLIICKFKDNVKARYALEASTQPMGISEYDINQLCLRISKAHFLRLRKSRMSCGR